MSGGPLIIPGPVFSAPVGASLGAASNATEDPSNAALSDDAFLAEQAGNLAALQGGLRTGVMDTDWAWIQRNRPEEVSFHEVLADLLNQRRSFIPPLDLAWEALEPQENKSPAVRIVGLMVLGELIPDLIGTKNLRKAANILQVILDDPKAHPRLRELALATMEEHHFRLSGANPTISSKLARWQAEIKDLYAFWQDVISEILGIRGEGEALLVRARAIFGQRSNSYPEWKKMLAMKCYAYHMPSSVIAEAPLSRQEADSATASLLQIIGPNGVEGRLSRAAAELFAQVVEAGIEEISRKYAGQNDTPSYEKKWARGKVRHLKLLLGAEHPLVLRLEKNWILRSWRVAEGNGVENTPVLATAPSPAVAPVPSIPWWRRLSARTGRMQRRIRTGAMDLLRRLE